ncbi:hypothetical protein GQ54DRAFT_306661 [Martensiomyces pterosporus]|nr:hypothetical protein GQ54DRAFT_306661 [Martensiomyces pterosporus]
MGFCGLIGSCRRVPMEKTHNEKQYLVGAPGREKIKRMMSLGKPKQAILEFGAGNGLDIPAAASIYSLLDSLGHTRWSIHNAVLDSAIAAAKDQIQGKQLPKDQHLALLAKIKPYLSIPRLQHLPLLLLAKQPQMVPDDFRDIIRSNAGLYSGCSLDVKRELWRKDLPLFRQHMRPLIGAYCEDDDLLEMSREIAGTNAKMLSRKRRSHKALTDISDAIDADLELYRATIEMIRELFLETQDPSLGTLRLDLIMVMHESDATEITASDVCHGLAWSLDACITKRIMDDRRVLEMQKYFDGIDTENAPYGEIALILCSPYSRHILAQNILSILEANAPNHEAGGNYSELMWPSIMLSMGLSAHSLLSQEHPTLPKLDRPAIKKFYKAMYAFIQAAQKHDRSAGVHDENTGGGSSSSSSNIKRLRRSSSGSFTSTTGGLATSDPSLAVTEESGFCPSEEDYKALASSELMRQVLYAFLLKRTASFDVGMLNLWLPVLGRAVPEFLGVPSDSIKEALPPASRDASTDSTNPPPLDIQMSHKLFAFEVDAFVQSLVSHIRNTSGLTAAIINTINYSLDQVNAEVCKMNVPLLRFLDRVGQVRHAGHEQAISLLADCERAVSAEYSGGGGSGSTPTSSQMPYSALSQGARTRVQNKESTVAH